MRAAALVHAPNTWQQALTAGIAALRQANIDSPELDAELLLAHTVGIDRSRLFAQASVPLAPDLLASYQTLLQRRARHEPLAYLTGRRWFFGREFLVTPDVLIPRPETEMLVEMGLAWLQARPRAGLSVVDVGAGSGAIAVSLAAEAVRMLWDVRVFATEASRAALAVAQANAARHDVEGRIVFLAGDLLRPLPEPVDLILANLPYIPTAGLAGLMPEVRDHDPRAALDGGPDGMAVIERLLAEAPPYLRPGAAIFLEVGFDQGERALAHAARRFPMAILALHRDLSGHDRVLSIQSR